MSRGEARDQQTLETSLMGSIVGRVKFLFLSFFLLIAISVGTTFWGLRAQAEDALLINLAGRQRMLVQQMIRLAATGEYETLAASIVTFEETLQALRSGGKVPYPTSYQWVTVPVATDPEIQAQLDRVAEAWKGYRPYFNIVLPATGASTTPTPEDTTFLAVLSNKLTEETDAVVRVYQESSRKRAYNLRGVQGAFFLCALGLLLGGRQTVIHSILVPLKRLNKAARRIRGGDLVTPVRVEGPAEIRHLGMQFEAMRLALDHSQQELLRWGQELDERVIARTRELNALYQVGQDISSRLDQSDLLASITAKARELVNAETSFLCLFDEAGNALNLEAISGPEETVCRVSTGANNPFVQQVVNPASTCPAGTPGCAETCGILAEAYRTSHQVVPLNAGNRVSGALCVGHRKSGAFSKDQHDLLTRMASAAALALENARLYNQAERLAILEERQRLAAEIHDGLAQTIDALGLLVGQACDLLETGQVAAAEKSLHGLAQQIHQASREVRQSITRLQDEPVKPAPLQEQVRGLVHKFCGEQDLVNWEINLPGELHLPDEDTQHVLGIAHEAIANALRHASPSHILVRLAYSDETARLQIEDDGCGFDPGAAQTGERKHFGLKILHARAAHLGGSLEVASEPGKGTHICLIWPARRRILPPPAQPEG